MKWLLLAAAGYGAYYLYEKAKQQPVASTGLPTDANIVKTLSIAGMPITVYLASSGYYLTSSFSNTVLGPYSTAQVSAALNAQSALGKLAGAL